jgi:chemotaxis protein methyltransferase CheR
LNSILQPLRAGRFRHVVFSSGSGGRRPVDFTLSPAPRLQPPAQFNRHEAAFVSELFETAGLDFRAYRIETLHRRLPAALRTLHATSLTHARQILHQDAGARCAALSAMVIGVTSFFRDEPVFDYLTFHALPSLLGNAKQLRIWSAGCSDGEELYSIAILLDQLKMLDGAYLLGTDCRHDAIARAREGAYHESDAKGICAPWLKQYFAREKDCIRICPRLISATQWKCADVVSVGEPGCWDMILCRNMGMYLKPECAGRLWNRFEHQLRPGGYLVLGKAERPVGTTRLSAVAPCVYRRDRG